MPALSMRITGVEPVARGLTPLLNFDLEVSSAPADQKIHGLLVHTQIQMQTPRRQYRAREQEQLRDLFGRLNAFKREQGLTSWDAVVEQVLPENMPKERPA